MYLNDEHWINSLLARCEHLEIRTPTAIARHKQDTANVVQRLGEQLESDSRGLTEVVIDRLIAGTKSLWNDPEVSSRLFASIAREGQLSQSVATIMQNRLVAAVREATPEIDHELQEKFDALAKQLTELHTKLGGADLNDTEGILARGGEAAEWWAKARTTLTQLEEVRKAWGDLAQTNKQTDTRPWVLVIADVPRERCLDDPDVNKINDVWSLLNAGLTPSLASIATKEFYARAKRVTDLSAKRQAERQRHAAAMRI